MAAEEIARESRLNKKGTEYPLAPSKEAEDAPVCPKINSEEFPGYKAALFTFNDIEGNGSSWMNWE